MRYKLLVVDDEPYSLVAIKSLLEENGHLVEAAKSGEEAIAKLKEDPDHYGIVILDYQMQGKNGANTAQEILSLKKDLYVLIHSGDGSQAAIQSSWEAGAVAFIEKNKGPELFLEKVNNWCRKYEETFRILRQDLSLSDNQRLINSIGMVGRSQAIADIATKILRLKTESAGEPVLILGENGTGKELIARALHDNSPRYNRPFIAVNSGAITENLIEAELFGHEKGAFTGADQKRIGKFQAADKGTLFLDEVGDMSLGAQVKLLRALQEQTICPVGSNREVKVDVRIIAATNRNLTQAIQEGKFREDLYYRLRGIILNIPPLRERPEDIAPLIAFYCDQYNARRGRNKRFLMKTVRYMERYYWPGNVRELQNTVFQILVETSADKIEPAHLDAAFFADSFKENVDDVPYPLNDYLGQVTKRYILAALNASESKREAAKKLGIPETTLRDILKKLALDRFDFKKNVRR